MQALGHEPVLSHHIHASLLVVDISEKTIIISISTNLWTNLQSNYKFVQYIDR